MIGLKVKFVQIKQFSNQFELKIIFAEAVHSNLGADKKPQMK
jgi:hypothetical protein